MILSMLWVTLFSNGDLFLILFLGGYDQEKDKSFNYVLKFDSTSETWTQVASMKYPRSGHAVSVIPVEEVLSYCLK